MADVQLKEELQLVLVVHDRVLFDLLNPNDSFWVFLVHLDLPAELDSQLLQRLQVDIFRLNYVHVEISSEVMDVGCH